MDNKKVYYVAKFKFSNENIPEEIKNKAIEYYNMMRCFVVDEINPKLDEWNKSYKGKVTDEYDMKYNSYIAKLENEICNHYNKLARGINPVTILADEYADLVGYFKYHGEVIKMSMTLNPEPITLDN